MPGPILERRIASIHYGELPETWRIPGIECFSAEKTLYDYQQDALKKAAGALYLYYEQEHDWAPDELPSSNDERKRDFFTLYGRVKIKAVRKYESRQKKKHGEQNPVFKILAEYLAPLGEEIPYQRLVNRMCFWMATGSGKTLIMVKLMEYLHSLMKRGEIPQRNMLVLAPSEHLLRQIRRTVDEFNQAGLHVELAPLRDIHDERQALLGDALTVYYHRSDNISDEQKEALTDYRQYENDGNWFVFLDEAHKGGKEDSRRQAYYAVMARNGFLFNFSATFTDFEDIVTTVKKYNLQEFVKNGHGKNICLARAEYQSFKNRREEISPRERRKIVLKSLLTLACVSRQVKKLRRETKRDNLYHNPLMLTLVNSVNTEIEKERNDLYSFFQTLRDIAMGEADAELFDEAKKEMAREWRNAEFLFEASGEQLAPPWDDPLKGMTLVRVRREIFLSGKKGALQLIRSRDNRELAFQLKNADSPFALIRIGDTSKWRNQLLAGYEETTALQEHAFFDELERSPITILMGSRAFFESWDSNRPNVINFINIGGADAKKFVVQSVGRGVRIETLPGERRRYDFLAPAVQKKIPQLRGDKVRLVETLFLFATNRAAVQSVLEGLEDEEQVTFGRLGGVEKAPPARINDEQDLLLLVPKYRKAAGELEKAKFAMSQGTLDRFKAWLDSASDSVLAVRDGAAAAQRDALRGAATGAGIQIVSTKDYADIRFLQERLLSHLSRSAKVPDGVRELKDKEEERDIIHFREIRAQVDYVEELQEKISQVKKGKPSDAELQAMFGKFQRKEMVREEFDAYMCGQDEAEFRGLTIKKLLNHYYFPVILGEDAADYIQHVIKVESEVDFLNKLEKWAAHNEAPWDAWMFSKLDESLDKVHIPYYDSDKNEYRRFLPDFVFWMCKKGEYRIVFVDPKGTAHMSYGHKVKGYKNLFWENGRLRIFNHKNLKVSVGLLLYNRNIAGVPEEYRDYWTDDVARIFAA